MDRKNNIIWLCEELDMSTSMLAGMLGITERTLLANKEVLKRDARLDRLTQVMLELKSEVPQCEGKRLNAIFHNSYIKLDDEDDEESSGISLIGYVNWSVRDNQEFCPAYVHAALWDYYKWIEEDKAKQPWYKRWFK